MEYSVLVEAYDKLESTSKRLEKTYIISEFLKGVNLEAMKELLLLLQGKVFPSYDERKIGVAAKLVIKALVISTGLALSKVESRWKDLGDLGEVAKDLTAVKSQQTLFSHKLTVKKVFGNLVKLASLEGKGAVSQKTSLISDLLTSAEPLEAKYIVRTILEELRVGVAHGTLRDAIVWAYFANECKIEYDDKKEEIVVNNREAYNAHLAAVQEAFDVSNDFALVASAAKSQGVKGLEKINLTVGIPIKVMLAQKAADTEDAFKRVGAPAAVEFKYDGFRMQVHKDKDSVRIFTRRLEEVTDQFPEVIEYVKSYIQAESFILDSEAVGFDPKTCNYLPFQHISQRIRRKYNIEELAKKLPVELNIFDIMYYDGKSLIKEMFSQRRKILEKIVDPQKRKICISSFIITDDIIKVKEFFDKSISMGNEGLMLKNLDAPYKPGARVGSMVKLKETMENLDLVIVAAEWGEGKRSQWLSSFTVAIIDDSGNFLEIGKASTGLKEKSDEGLSFEQMSELLKPLIISEKGKTVFVKPQIVVEIAYEEIQKSPTYPSGFALRFPRIIGLREERSPEDASTADYVEDLYYSQNK